MIMFQAAAWSVHTSGFLLGLLNSMFNSVNEKAVVTTTAEQILFKGYEVLLWSSPPPFSFLTVLYITSSFYDIVIASGGSSSSSRSRIITIHIHRTTAFLCYHYFDYHYCYHYSFLNVMAIIIIILFNNYSACILKGPSAGLAERTPIVCERHQL